MPLPSFDTVFDPNVCKTKISNQQRWFILVGDDRCSYASVVNSYTLNRSVDCEDEMVACVGRLSCMVFT